MSEFPPPAGRHDGELPDELRPFVAAWRCETEAPPDLAAAVVSALRVERAAAPPARPGWRHAALAVCAAGLVAGAGVWWAPAGPTDAGVSVTASDGAETPAPSDAVVATQAEASPAPAVPSAEPASPLDFDRPAARFVAFAPPLPDPADWLTRDALAEAWAAVPAADPDRTWRDELADGVRPYRRGVSTAVGLFARAVPPGPRGL